MSENAWDNTKDRLASPQQKKMFFAVGHQLGIDPERLKERAKTKYGLMTFTDITVNQLTPLIDSLQERIDKELIKCPHCQGTGYVNKTTLVDPPTVKI